MTVIWNPSTMEITGEIPAPENYLRDGLATSSNPARMAAKAMFTYVADGKGIFSVFDDRGIERDETTDPSEFASLPTWEIWNLDLEARSGEPLEGIPPNTGAYTPIKLDGRLFLMVPGNEWGGTQLYEVKDERAEPFVKVPGWSYMFEKIR